MTNIELFFTVIAWVLLGNIGIGMIIYFFRTDVSFGLLDIVIGFCSILWLSIIYS